MTEQEEFEFRQRLEQEQAAQQASAGAPDQVNILYGTGAGSLGGLIAGSAINKGVEAMRAGAPAAGGFGGQPGNGAAPGQKYAAKTGYGSGTGYTVEEVVEHKRAQEKPIGKGKITSKIAGNSPMNVDRMLQLEAAKKAEDARRAAALAPTGLMSKLPAPVQAAGRFIGGAGQAGVAPYLGRAVAGGGAGYQAVDAYNRFQQGDYPGAAVSGVGALGSAASMIPSPVTRVGGAGLGIGAEMLNQYLDSLKQKVNTMGQPQQQQPQQPMPQMARGGLVHLKKGGQPELGEARAYEPSYSEKIRDYAAKYMSPEQADRLFGGPRASLVDEINPIGAALRAPGAVADAAKGFVRAGKEGDYLAGMGNYLVGAANVAPVIGPAARGAAKLGPKAAEMAENYLTKIGGIQNIVPPGQRPAYQIGASEPTKMSDFLQNNMNKYLVPTQADRMAGVGGPSYSANQLELPQYANRAWGSGNQGTATGITNLAKDPRFGGTENQIFSPVLGDPQMHISNQLAFDAVKDAFYKNQKKMTPEMRAKINEFMRSGGTSLGAKQKFDPIPGFEIADKAMIEDLGKSFQNRGLIGKHAFGGRDVGGTKAQIIPYNQMLLEMQDPTTIGAKTFSVGPRAFNLSGEVENVPRPDLNRAYPIQLMGKDYGVNFEPVPTELSLMDFGRQWRKDTGNLAPKKSGELQNPGYFEHTLGYKPKGSSERVYPRQQVTEEFIKELQRSGFAEGGEVEGYQAGGKVGNILSILKKLGLSEESIAAWKAANGVNQRQVRNPILQQAAKDLAEGKITSEQYRALARTEMPINAFTNAPNMPSQQDIANALKSNQLETGIIGVNKNIAPGSRVSSRLDIPAYDKYDKWIVSLHDPLDAGKSIGYGQTAHLKGPIDFTAPPKAGHAIATGKSDKTTYARIHGDWEPTDPEDVYKRAQDLMGDPQWAQVGLNPFRHSYFYDKADMAPVVGGQEALQVGPLVLVKKPQKVDPDDPQFRLSKDKPETFAAGGLATFKKKKK
jgi:hypothetical protein